MKKNVRIIIFAAALVTLSLTGYAVAMQACCVQPEVNSCCTSPGSECCK